MAPSVQMLKYQIKKNRKDKISSANVWQNYRRNLFLYLTWKLCWWFSLFFLFVCVLICCFEFSYFLFYFGNSCFVSVVCPCPVRFPSSCRYLPWCVSPVWLSQLCFITASVYKVSVFCLCLLSLLSSDWFICFICNFCYFLVFGFFLWSLAPLILPCFYISFL